MATHDPRREIEKLRDHLASHDKPIALLLGAGASCAVRDQNHAPLVPAVAELTTRCEGAIVALGEPFPAAYEAIASEVAARGPVNVETILSDVRRKIDAVGGTDTLAGLTSGQLERVEATIRRTIADAALPDESRIPERLPHHALARWIRRTDRATPVEIFTPNYDTLIERGLEDERIPAFDGFVGSRRPFFSPQSLVHEALAPGRQWTRLWKIHGSINWSWLELKDGARRIVRGSERDDGPLILPSFHKYDESRKQPYAAMLERLQRVLVEREDSTLITLGYSFGDEHINQVLFDALDVRERMHIFSLHYSDPDLTHPVVTRAVGRSNLIVYGPERAVVGGVVGTWRLIEPVDRLTAPLLDVPFDSDAAEGDADASLTGKLRLGDFMWFARFLDSIVGEDA